MNRQYFNKLTRIELKLQKMINALEKTLKKQEKRGFYKRASDRELVSKESWLKIYNKKMNHLQNRITPLTAKKRELYWETQEKKKIKRVSAPLSPEVASYLHLATSLMNPRSNKRIKRNRK